MKKISNQQRFEYLFRATLDSGPIILKDHKPYREISVLSTQTLSTLARVVVSSFGFYFDHCFGFYDDFKDPYESKEIYELFTDIPEDPTPGAKGVTYIKIPRAFTQTGKKMLFLFDYGDGWYFTVELLKIKPTHRSRKNPQVIKKVGLAPEQYPDWDEVMETEEILEEGLRQRKPFVS